MYSDVEDIEVEDTAAILARRQREDELTAKMQELITNFDKYLENKDKCSADENKKEVDSLVQSLCKSGLGPADTSTACTVDVMSWKVAEVVAARRRCYRAFTADSLTVASLLEEGAARCKSCEHVSSPGTWQQVVPHVNAFCQQMYVHRCPVTEVFPRFLLFALSVSEDGYTITRFYDAVTEYRIEPATMLDEILIVLYNWGFDEKLLGYSLESNVELQRLKSKCGLEAGGGGEVAASAADVAGAPKDKGLPVCKLAVENTLKCFLLRMPHLDMASQEEAKGLAVLRGFAAALADASLVCAGIYLRPLLYKMLDRLNIETWPDEKYLKLVKMLHFSEFSAFGQYAAVRALVDRPLRDDRSALKGCVAWAIMQVLHGVEPDKVKYVTRLRPELFSKLPPGPVAYADLTPKQLYLSLQMLGDCASSAARADADDPAFYGGLLRHVYRLQQELPSLILPRSLGRRVSYCVAARVKPTNI